MGATTTNREPEPRTNRHRTRGARGTPRRTDPRIYVASLSDYKRPASCTANGLPADQEPDELFETVQAMLERSPTEWRGGVRHP